MISQARTKTGGFKTWMRVVALVLVVVFVPQQVAWAVDYDWRSIWRNSQPQAAGSSSAALAALPYSAIKSAGFEKQIAFNIKESLDSLRRSGSLSIQFNNNIVVGRTIQKPITKDNVENIYRKLVDSRNNIITCGAYSLYNLFVAYGIISEDKQGPSILDIANTLILIDLLSSKNLEPTFNKNQLEISFYSLIKAAEVYGLRLQPFHFSTFQTDLESVNKQISFPFIATIDEPHTVLVKSIDENGVLIVDNDVERMISLDEFKQRFMGYCLAVDVVKEKGIEPVSNEFAKSIKIKGRSRKNDLPTFNEVYKETNPWDTLLSVGIMVGLNLLPGGKNSTSTFGQRLAQNIYTSNISQAAMIFATDQWKWKAKNVQILGYAVQGGINGRLSGSTFARGALQGATQGYFSTVAYDALKRTELFRNEKLRTIGQSVVSLAGNSLGYIAFSAGSSIFSGNNVLASFAEPFKGKSGEQFGRYFIRESIGIGFEYAAAKGVFGKTLQQYPSYSRIMSTTLGSWVDPVLGGAADFRAAGYNSKVDYIKDAIWNSTLQGAASIALNAIGGEYSNITGKNKWGLTAMQMHLVTYSATSLMQSLILPSAIDADIPAGATATFREKMKAVGKKIETGMLNNLYQLRDNMDMGEYGKGGWNDFQVMEKMAQFSGAANFYSNADYAMRQNDYTSWKKFVNDGYAFSLFPSMAYSITEYASSSLHTTAAGNLASATDNLLTRVPIPGTAKLFGYKKNVSLNDSIRFLSSLSLLGVSPETRANKINKNIKANIIGQKQTEKLMQPAELPKPEPTTKALAQAPEPPASATAPIDSKAVGSLVESLQNITTDLAGTKPLETTTEQNSIEQSSLPLLDDDYEATPMSFRDLIFDPTALPPALTAAPQPPEAVKTTNEPATVKPQGIVTEQKISSQDVPSALAQTPAAEPQPIQQQQVMVRDIESLPGARIETLVTPQNIATQPAIAPDLNVQPTTDRTAGLTTNAQPAVNILP
ncbi:MAG: cysteine peptidase family C39 domain-containing protein, partial [Candidatus Omnitrophica bacterium]|nr:cysteine peptidase family C39 domain-containing protein [Candidatus Omnitrophota bacterium]